MIRINFESIPKFHLSLGLVLIFLGILLFLGTAWVVDKQTDKAIDAAYNKISTNEDNEYTKAIDDIIITRIEVLSNMVPLAVLISKILIGLGIISSVGGYVAWIVSNKRRNI